MRGVKVPAVRMPSPADEAPFGPTSLPGAIKRPRKDRVRQTSNSFRPRGTKGRGPTGSDFATESYVNGKSRFD